VLLSPLNPNKQTNSLCFKYTVFYYFALIGGLSSAPIIEPELIDRIENSSVSFRCIPNNNLYRTISWSRISEGYFCIYNQTCGIILTNTENEKYQCKCEHTDENELIFELHIDEIAQKDHNNTIICEVVNNTFMTNQALLFVKGKYCIWCLSLSLSLFLMVLMAYRGLLIIYTLCAKLILHSRANSINGMCFYSQHFPNKL
jgi:hypothetical protein